MMFIGTTIAELPKHNKLWEFSFLSFLVPIEGRTILFFRVSSFFEFVQPTIELFEFALHRLHLMG